jgi:hypothetical protein
MQQDSYSPAEEIASRGEALWQSRIRPQIGDEERGKVVAIDVDSGTYEIGKNALEASEKLLAYRPDAEIWCVRVGHRALYRIGMRSAAIPG